MKKAIYALLLSGVLAVFLYSSPVYSSSRYVPLNKDTSAIGLRNSFRFIEYSEVLNNKLEDLEYFMKNKGTKDYTLLSEYQLLVSQLRGVNSILSETSKNNSNLDNKIKNFSEGGLYSENELSFSRNSLKFGQLSCNNPSERMTTVYSSSDLLSKVSEIADENLATRLAHFHNSSKFFGSYSSNYESVNYTIHETRRITKAQNEYPDLSFRLVASAKNLLRGLDIGLSQKGGKLNNGERITVFSAVGLANMSFYVFGDKETAKKIMKISGVDLSEVDFSGDSLDCEVDHSDRDRKLSSFGRKTSQTVNNSQSNSNLKNNTVNNKSKSSNKDEVKEACEKSLGTVDNVLGVLGIKNICD